MTEVQENIKLNIGCGGRPLNGYINIDMDTIEDMKKRYPHQAFNDDIKIYQYDIFDLPYESNSISSILCDAFIEHLSFIEEKKFFLEVQRVLKVGGRLEFSVPNFEKVAQMWLDAKDDWKDFYRDDEEAIMSEHWFGNNSYTMDNRWGYLTTILFGNQNGEGSLHKNCYTLGKIRAMTNKLGFKEIELSEFLWKGERDPMIKVIIEKM